MFKKHLSQHGKIASLSGAKIAAAILVLNGNSICVWALTAKIPTFIIVQANVRLHFLYFIVSELLAFNFQLNKNKMKNYNNYCDFNGRVGKRDILSKEVMGKYREMTKNNIQFCIENKMIVYEHTQE